jgi:TatA/E family protein of Tat protein translocase
MFPSLGFPELMIIMVIALIIFGPRKLPELGRSLGKSIGEFKKASNELKSTLEEEIRMEEVKEERKKIEVEQASALSVNDSAPKATDHEIHPPTDVTPDEPTISRTPTTGTSA